MASMQTILIAIGQVKVLNKLFQWLAPGKQFKRWIVIAFIGLVLLFDGCSAIYGRGIVCSFLRRLAPDISFLPWSTRLSIVVPLLAIGSIFLFIGAYRLWQRVVLLILDDSMERAEEIFHQNPWQPERVVVLGGGNGQANMLRAIKNLPLDITAVVAVTDDGGSSGRLRQDLGILPPGDIRNCLVALADTEEVVANMLNCRFQAGVGLEGHNLGNLLVAALTQNYAGDFGRAIQDLSRLLAIKGQVLPISLDNVVLKAEMTDGRVITGESNLVADAGIIKTLSLEPADCRPLDSVIAAIEKADMIIIGPGSLYTSLITNLLVPGVVEAMNRSQAKVYYVCNILTQRGETDSFSAYDHLQAIRRHVPHLHIDKILIHQGDLSSAQKVWCEENDCCLVLPGEKLATEDIAVIEANFLYEENLFLHNPETLQQVFAAEINEEQRNSFYATIGKESHVAGFLQKQRKINH
ncbi:MAG: YvcK family protein [Peptococcaceae bacterium]|nr:YvcK family protein [Peptococcaceae bacterium]